MMKNKKGGLPKQDKKTARYQKAWKFAVFLLMLVCFTGCAGTPASGNAAEKGSVPGTKTEVPLAEIMERQKNGEKMLVLFVQDGCSYCEAFDEIVDTYLETHDITLNIVNLTTEEVYNPKENIISALNTSVGGLEQTPALYYIESKESVHLLDYTDGEYTMDDLTAFIKKYELDP